MQTVKLNKKLITEAMNYRNELNYLNKFKSANGSGLNYDSDDFDDRIDKIHDVQKDLLSDSKGGIFGIGQKSPQEIADIGSKHTSAGLFDPHVSNSQYENTLDAYEKMNAF